MKKLIRLSVAGIIGVTLAFGGSGAAFASPVEQVAATSFVTSEVLHSSPFQTAKKKVSVVVKKKPKAKIDFGKQLTFTGKTSTALKGKKVVLQIKSGKKWKTVKTAKVKSNLKFSLKAKANKAGTVSYRVFSPATKHTKSASSKIYKIKVQKKTSVNVTSRTKANVDLGAKLTLSGKTSKSLKGKKLNLQIKTATSWKTVKTVKVKSNATFKVSVKATQAGEQKYRVLAPATKTTKSAKSKTFKYKVWAWYNIGGTQVDKSRLEAWGAWTEPTIGGKAFQQSATFGWGLGGYSYDGWASYNVNYVCTTLKADIGLSDQSKADSKRTFYVKVDDTLKSLGTKGVGAATPITLDITDAYRVTLGADLNGNKVWGMAVFGTPKVYCSVNPAG